MSDPDDFNYGILEVTSHRPWPMPSSPWVMTQTWHDLLFAHWPVPAELLRPLVPPEWTLDTFEGQAWIGIVPFTMSNVAPRWMPALPWISAFPELNVRTYVEVNGKAGVYFFSLDAGNPLAVGTARTLAHLPYFTADMQVAADIADGITYRSRRSSRLAPPAAFDATYRPVGPAAPPAPGTLDHFLTERYCLFTRDASRRTLRLEIHHPPWPLQAAAASIVTNTMAEAAGITLPSIPPLLHFAKRQDMVAWWPQIG